MKFEDQENPDKGELGDADIKNVIKNVDENQILQTVEDPELPEVVDSLKKTKSMLQTFAIEISKRIQETWCDQQLSFILIEVNNAQDKLESYIKKELNSKQNAVFSNPKLEPIEVPDQSLDVKEDLKDAALIADDGIKLEVEEAMEAQRQYSVLEQICFALDPNSVYDENQMYEDEAYDDYDEDYEPSFKQETRKERKTRRERNSVKNEEVECLICGIFISGVDRLNTHYKDHGDGPYKCLVCNEETEDIPSLSEHYSNTHPLTKNIKVYKTKKNKCILCDEIFPDNQTLNDHYDTHGPGPYDCKTCGASVSDLKTMKDHVTRHKESSCAVCDRKFPTRKRMIIHRNSHGEGPFDCRQCGKTRKNMKEFLHHLRDHTLNDEVACEVCNKKMARKKLKDHMGYHTGEDMEECTICYKSHPKSFMKIHMQLKHLNGGRFYCKFCDCSFKQESLLEKHTKIHTGEKSHCCDKCGKAFLHPRQLKNHLFTIHGIKGEEESCYKCKICDKAYFIPSLLKRHMLNHTGEKPYKCDHCPKAFRSAGQRINHQRIHTGERPYSCDQCGKAFVQRAHMRTHIKLVHDGEKMKPKVPTPQMCGLCGKTFYSKQTLRNHELLHTGETPFKCEHCDKSFAHTHGLNMHIKQTHLTEDDLIALTCDQCGKVYKSKLSLKLHIKNIHEQAEKIPCPHCTVEFTRKENMLRHIKDVHKGIKNHKCDVCSQAFCSSTVLNQHMRVHTGEKPFSCDVCNKAFTQRSSLYSHKKKGSCS